MVRVDARCLLDSGLLFEINRTILHPLGLALAINDGDGRDVRLMRTNDPTGIVFADGDLAEGHAKLVAFMDHEGEKRHHLRENALGYVMQPVPMK